MAETASTATSSPNFGEAVRVWLRIGLLSFGGPAAQIALMHREVVEERKWLDEETYLHALNFCMLLPGPEAQQLATYAGWRLHGLKGALAAGLLFVLPGAVVVLGLAALYAQFGTLPNVEAVFLGIKAAVLVIVIEALLRVAKRALKRPADWAIAAASFAALFFLNAPFPLVIIVAGLIGALLLRGGASMARAAAAPAPAFPNSVPQPSWRGLLTTIAIWLAVWWLPVGLSAVVLGSDHVLTEIGIFFSKLAVVTFGGAYSVLAYMAQQAVETHHWLKPGEMLDGLGLAETTPGPLILVTEFVGYLAAYRQALPGGSPAMGLLGALMTLWVTFAPCFLWILAGAPYIERIRRIPWLASALAAITAAVVGVILNLSLWFALHVLFATVGTVQVWPLRLTVPDFATLDWRAAAIAITSGLALLRFHLGIARTLAIAAVLGLAARFVLGGA